MTESNRNITFQDLPSYFWGVPCDLLQMYILGSYRYVWHYSSSENGQLHHLRKYDEQIWFPTLNQRYIMIYPGIPIIIVAYVPIYGDDWRMVHYIVSHIYIYTVYPNYFYYYYYHYYYCYFLLLLSYPLYITKFQTNHPFKQDFPL